MGAFLQVTVLKKLFFKLYENEKELLVIKKLGWNNYQ
jgi:hypothetical protein